MHIFVNSGKNFGYASSFFHIPELLVCYKPIIQEYGTKKGMYAQKCSCKKWDVGGGHWLVRMEWHPAGLSVCLPLLIFPCTMKSRSSLLAPAHPGGPGKRAVKRLCVCVCVLGTYIQMTC